MNRNQRHRRMREKRRTRREWFKRYLAYVTAQDEFLEKVKNDFLDNLLHRAGTVKSVWDSP